MLSLKKITDKAILFWRMPYQHKGMFIINFFLCGCARAAIVSLPLSRLAPYFGQFHQTTRLSTILAIQQRQRAVRLGRLVRLAAKFTPWDSSCLTQAMVAKFWCRLYKIPHVLYIGFAKSPEDPKGYKGHAWLTAGPIAVTGGPGHLNYSIVSTYVYFPKVTQIQTDVQIT